MSTPNSTPAPLPIDLVSVVVAARALGLHRTGVYRLIAAGILKAVRKPGLGKKRPHLVWVTRESLDAVRAGGVSA